MKKLTSFLFLAALAFAATPPPPDTAETLPPGSKVTLLATADGTPAPTFQWIKDGAPIAGATATSYVLDSLIVAHAARYTVTATNSEGSATSPAYILTVAAPPTFASITVTVIRPNTVQIQATPGTKIQVK